MKTIQLGSQGLKTPPLGLGCMGMTSMFGADMYGPANEAEAIKTIRRSLELGGNFLDTADLYGPLLNEQLVGKAIAGNRDKYVIATKFGFEINEAGSITGKINGTKNYIKKAVERSLRNLKTDYIDLYYQHRLDFATPIEETMEAMSELVKEGKVKYLGLSEVSADTIKRAHAIHPLSAVQTEYSLFERNVEAQGIKSVMEQLGITLVAYSPLGRGFLSGQFQSPDDFPENDFRRMVPKYQGEQFQKNLDLLKEIQTMAAEKEISTTQLALAWIMAKGAVPIPGTKRIKYVEQNIAASEVSLSRNDLDRLESIIPLSAETGDRYDADNMQSIDQ
ncbi:MAG: aldo/keto reductase [Carboxylicivirga sp.]|jgi:aryl-alcohol dehydrogenase-like predicted oxidoreductase|nr:aldo/keto reductase [Carboxylicivirga sp.]